MRKFTIPCDFGGIKEPFDVYIGNSDPNYHPLYYQAMWLKKDRGCIIPADVMESFAAPQKMGVQIFLNEFNRLKNIRSDS